MKKLSAKVLILTVLLFTPLLHAQSITTFILGVAPPPIPSPSGGPLPAPPSLPEP